MPNYIGVPGVFATDGCGCYDNNNNCYCADCYYYGKDANNCSIVGNKNLKPIKWDGNNWVLTTPLA